MASVDFAYHRPSSFSEATALLASLDARPLAGGQSLVPQMFSRRVRCDALVDLADLEELATVEEEQSTVAIGAMCRQRTLECSATMRAGNPMLIAVLARLGPLPVRGRGTVGGHLALADPASELLATAVAQDWQLRLGAGGANRQVSAESFVTEPFATALRRGELLQSIVVPKTVGQGWSIETVRVSRSARPAAGVAVCVALSGSCIGASSIVAFAVGSVPRRLRAVEAAINGQTVTNRLVEEAGRLARPAVEAREGVGVSAQWRQHAIGRLTHRALSMAIDSAHSREAAHV